MKIRFNILVITIVLVIIPTIYSVTYSETFPIDYPNTKVIEDYNFTSPDLTAGIPFDCDLGTCYVSTFQDKPVNFSVKDGVYEVFSPDWFGGKVSHYESILLAIELDSALIVNNNTFANFTTEYTAQNNNGFLWITFHNSSKDCKYIFYNDDTNFNTYDLGIEHLCGNGVRISDDEDVDALVTNSKGTPYTFGLAFDQLGADIDGVPRDDWSWQPIYYISFMVNGVTTDGVYMSQNITSFNITNGSIAGLNTLPSVNFTLDDNSKCINKSGENVTFYFNITTYDADGDTILYSWSPETAIEESFLVNFDVFEGFTDRASAIETYCQYADWINYFFTFGLSELLPKTCNWEDIYLATQDINPEIKYSIDLIHFNSNCDMPSLPTFANTDEIGIYKNTYFESYEHYSLLFNGRACASASGSNEDNPFLRFNLPQSNGKKASLGFVIGSSFYNASANILYLNGNDILINYELFFNTSNNFVQLYHLNGTKNFIGEFHNADKTPFVFGIKGDTDSSTQYSGVIWTLNTSSTDLRLNYTIDTDGQKPITAIIFNTTQTELYLDSFSSVDYGLTNFVATKPTSIDFNTFGMHDIQLYVTDDIQILSDNFVQKSQSAYVGNCDYVVNPNDLELDGVPISSALKSTRTSISRLCGLRIFGFRFCWIFNILYVAIAFIVAFIIASVIGFDVAFVFFSLEMVFGTWLLPFSITFRLIFGVLLAISVGNILMGFFMGRRGAVDE